MNQTLTLICLKTSYTWLDPPKSWIRFHHEPRNNLFVPKLNDAHVRLEELGSKRTTLVLDDKFCDKWINDTWNYTAECSRDIGETFTGATCLEKTLHVEHPDLEPEGEDLMAQKPKLLLCQFNQLPKRNVCTNLRTYLLGPGVLFV